MLRRLTSILLLATFLGLGTGALAYLHECQHAAEDAVEDRDARAAGLPVEHHQHDDSNCPVHAQLHMPLIAVAGVPPLALSGRMVGLVVVGRQSLPHRRPPGRADCRDPPMTTAV